MDSGEAAYMEGEFKSHYMRFPAGMGPGSRSKRRMEEVEAHLPSLLPILLSSTDSASPNPPSHLRRTLPSSPPAFQHHQRRLCPTPQLSSSSSSSPSSPLRSRTSSTSSSSSPTFAQPHNLSEPPHQRRSSVGTLVWLAEQF